MGLGAVVVGIAVLAMLVWAGYIINSRRPRPTAVEGAPQNLAPYLTDDELENKRVSKALVGALVSAGVLALVIPVYYLGESSRQAEAAEAQLERDIEEGEHWFEEFQCLLCHGAAGTGGGATFIEPRSGLETTWAAPSLNDVFYRYSEEDVRFWITFGRRGTPMPPAGLEGGGSMTSQQIDQVIAYIHSIQIPQEEAVAQVDTRVSLALDRLDRADESIGTALADQERRIAEIESVPAVFERVERIPDEIADVLAGAGTCTDHSARLAERPCESEGSDGDRDDITDAAEVELTRLLGRFATETGLEQFDVRFDPVNGFSTTDSAGDPIADFDLLAELLTDLEVEFINLRVTAQNNETFLEGARVGAEFLEESGAARRYAVDVPALADEAFQGDEEAARRAVGLFNAYCARCHTAGYAAGVAFEREAGSGAWGPSLLGGKAVRQFPDPEEHSDFIVKGSESGQNYGVNGLGNGYMPAFGFILGSEDIELIVAYERAM